VRQNGGNNNGEGANSPSRKVSAKPSRVERLNLHGYRGSYVAKSTELRIREEVMADEF